MAKTLQDYFPMIRSRKEVLNIVYSREELRNTFESWHEEQQEEFLDFCSGTKGVKILYDAFFKEIFNPEVHPDRLERLLEILLNKKVKITQILPNDSVRLADESTLLITDIVVELEDGTLANIEIQKIGYAFPGQRIACYSADLLLRQYKRVKSKRKKKFTYRDIKKVYTIVLFEKSTTEFHRFSKQYIHRSHHIFDSGLELETLQEYILIALDIFREKTHNKGIESELDGWLTFISCDEPEEMIQLLEKYPEFREMYQEIYDICKNVEGVMDMFSKELLELDRNTVQYMIEEQEKELKKKEKELQKKREELREKGEELQQKDTELQKKIAELERVTDKIIVLSRQRDGLEDENNGLKDENNGLKDENNGLKDENLILKERLIVLERELEKLKN